MPPDINSKCQAVFNALDAKLYEQTPLIESYHICPLQLEDLFGVSQGVAHPTQPLILNIARLDQLDFYISGNKWPKMRLWFQTVLQQYDLAKVTPLASMGGAHSNHLLAFVAAAKALKLKSRCYVRANGQGCELQMTPTLERLTAMGSELVPVSRQDYRVLRQAAQQGRVDEAFFLPEGGKSNEAVSGVANWAKLHQAWLKQYASLVVGCGTGTWLAGLSLGVPSVYCIGVPAVAGQAWLESDIHIMQKTHYTQAQWTLDWRFPQRKFGPVSPSVIETMRQIIPVPMDPIYMPRLVYVLLNRWWLNQLPVPCLMMHSGGLQALNSQVLSVG